MPSPLKLSLDDIRREAHEEVAFLKALTVKQPSWTWPREMLVLSREFETLVTSDVVELGRARDFTARVRLHIRDKRLKGMEPTIWRAEALEDAVREKADA